MKHGTHSKEEIRPYKNTNLILVTTDDSHGSMAESQGSLSDKGNSPATQFSGCIRIVATKIPNYDNGSQDDKATSNRRHIP